MPKSVSPSSAWYAVVAAVLAAVAACGVEPAVQETLIRPVRTAAVQSTGSEQVRSFTGSTEANAEIALSFKVSGTLMRLRVRVGDAVKAGQLIAELEPSDYALREGEAKATRALRLAEQRNAQAQYDRVRALYENNNASRTELDAARAKADAARSMLESNSKKLELATKQLSYTRLKAPVDGLVAEVPEGAAASAPVTHEARLRFVEPVVSEQSALQIVELDAAESREILDALFAHATDADNIYTHHWQTGDFVMWDNRVTMHRALSNYAAQDVRHMLRTSVTGENPA